VNICTLDYFRGKSEAMMAGYSMCGFNHRTPAGSDTTKSAIFELSTQQCCLNVAIDDVIVRAFSRIDANATVWAQTKTDLSDASV